MSPRRPTRRHVSSASEPSDQGTTVDAVEVTSVAVPTDTRVDLVPNETAAEPIERAVAVSGDTTGRTWADIVHPYSSNERYLYLIVLLVIALGFGGTGHLSTLMEQAAAAGVTVASWIVLWLVQRR